MSLAERIAANKKAEHERGEHRLKRDSYCTECAAENDRLRSNAGSNAGSNGGVNGARFTRAKDLTYR